MPRCLILKQVKLLTLDAEDIDLPAVVQTRRPATCAVVASRRLIADPRAFGALGRNVAGE